MTTEGMTYFTLSVFLVLHFNPRHYPGSFKVKGGEDRLKEVPPCLEVLECSVIALCEVKSSFMEQGLRDTLEAL